MISSIVGWLVGLAPIALVWTGALGWALVHARRHPVPSALVAVAYGVFLLHQLLWLGPQVWLMSATFNGLPWWWSVLRVVRIGLSVVEIALIAVAALIQRGPAPVIE